MTADEVVHKLMNALAASPMTEADAAHVFSLSRKLIERLSKDDRKASGHLKFYCDWTLHSTIDRSSPGAEIVMRIHDIVGDHLNKSDNLKFTKDIALALGLNEMGRQIAELLKVFDGTPFILGDKVWRQLVSRLFEIISGVPLTIGARGNVAALSEAIKQRPFKGNRHLEKLEISRIPSEKVSREGKPGTMTYCLVMTTNDMVRLVTPVTPFD